jgi:hypothetical protein
MLDIIIPLGILIGLMLVFNDKFCMKTAHFLNNLFNLPHPGPNDRQGACWCRRHEGPNKYNFTDYLFRR